MDRLLDALSSSLRPEHGPENPPQEAHPTPLVMASALGLYALDDVDEDHSDDDGMDAEAPRRVGVAGSGKNADGQHLPRGKKRKSEDERLMRCRERNRVHARNTRERKKLMMDCLQQRIEVLFEEKIRLTTTTADTSVASILMSLGGGGGPGDAATSDTSSLPDMVVSTDEAQGSAPLSTSSKDLIAATIEKLRSQISAEISDDDEVDVEGSLELLKKNKAGCTPSELEKIRRERNRLHARNTRQRKKKMMFEMESIVRSLEEEILVLRRAHGGGAPEVQPQIESATAKQAKPPSKGRSISASGSTSSSSVKSGRSKGASSSSDCSSGGLSRCGSGHTDETWDDRSGEGGEEQTFDPTLLQTVLSLAQHKGLVRSTHAATDDNRHSNLARHPSGNLHKVASFATVDSTIHGLLGLSAEITSNHNL